jgi:hypothetical protein
MQITKALGAYCLQVDADQIVAAHAGFARHAGGDDHHIRALDVGIAVGALVLRVEAVDRRGFGDIEALALRNALGDIEQDDVAQFLHAREMGERAADLAGANEGDLLAGHEQPRMCVECLMAGRAPSDPCNPDGAATPQKQDRDRVTI